MGNIIWPSRFTPTTDPYFSNVVLLCGFDGANGSTTIVDESSYARSTDAVAGGVAITSGFPKFGNTLGIDGINDYVRWADSNDFSPGSGDFTIELFFAHTPSITTTDGLLTKWTGTTQLEWAFFVKSTLIEFYYSTTGANAIATTYNPGYSADTYYHIAASRVGNTLHLCFNGTIVNTRDVTGVTIFNSTGKVTLGANNEGASAFFNGWAEEVRITKGVGRYSGSVSSSYTVPTAKFPRS